MSDIALSVDGLTRNFTQGGVTIEVLRGVDLSIRKGEIVALLGPSGSGKSTFLQAVGLLEGGFGGKLYIDGVDCTKLRPGERTRIRREKLGFVYQFHHLLPDFTARENVMMPLLIAGASHGAAASRADTVLSQLGLAQRLTHKPSQLSGGEQQRVAVARALATDPPLILADEPTGNLDEGTGFVVLDEFLRLVRERNASAIVATHNRALAERMDRIITLHEGRLEAR